MKHERAALGLFTRGKSRLQVAATTFFVFLMVVSSVLTLAYTYYKTSEGALRSARMMMKSSNRTISRNVLRYMGTARRTSNALGWSLRDSGSIPADKDKIFALIVGQLKAQREIFSISVGDATGSVLMVGKLFDDSKYSRDRTKSLPTNVQYRSQWLDRRSYPPSEYHVYYDKDFNVVDREDVATQAVKSNIRKRSWFKEALKRKKNFWTDVRIYRNGEFATANVRPLLDKTGEVRLVVSVSIALSLSDGISARLNVGENGIAFLLDEDGRLIAYPERKKIVRRVGATNGKPGKYVFAKVDQVGNAALAEAFKRYKIRANLKDIRNIPRRLNYNDYRTAIKRLDPEERIKFNAAYTVDEEKRSILLRQNLPKKVRQTMAEVLESINYTFNMRFTTGGQEYLASFHNFPESYGKTWMIGTLVPIDEYIGVLKKTIVNVTLMSVGVLVLSLLVIVIFFHRILKPLKMIATDMNRIQGLDIDEAVTHRSFFYEITLIADALAAMKHGLKAFSKFVPFTLVQQLISSGKGATLGGERRHLTIMFTDIEGFTTISESMSTEGLLQHVSEYLDDMTKIILSQQGTVDKYIGDAIMCFWGAPVVDDAQEYHSCKTALLCQTRLRALNARWTAEGKPALHTRFGINSGEVSVGNMGSSDRMNYTVLGDAVNLASRLEGVNKYYSTNIIVGESTYEVVKTKFCFRPLDVVAVKGKHHGVKIYQLLAGPANEPGIAPSPDDLRLRELTERAFTAYLDRDFKSAMELYADLSRAFPHDPLGALFVARCREYLVNPPDAEWDGVMRLKAK